MALTLLPTICLSYVSVAKAMAQLDLGIVLALLRVGDEVYFDLVLLVTHLREEYCVCTTDET
jgi:hypothetical protein